MKKIILVLFILLFTCGCGNNDGRVLNVLNWSSYIPNEVISDFSKESGIKVNYSTYSSNEELLAKISSSKDGTYDLIFPSDYMLEVMIRREMLDTMDTSKLENFDNLNENYFGLEYDKNNEYSIPFVIISVRSVLENMDPNLELVASDLGASKLKTFLYVIIQSLMPGILSGAQLAFTLSLDDVVISYFTSGPGSNTLPLHIFSMIKTGVTPDVNALISIMLMIIFVILTLSTVISLRNMKKVR